MVEEVLREHIRAQPGVDLRLGHAVTGLAADGTAGSRSRCATPAAPVTRSPPGYVIGCDGAAGVVREKIGARWAGHSDPRPNFNVVIRAPSLDTHLGPAVQYWVLGAALRPPPGYPWDREFLLVRPDQHIAWRARDAAEIDLDLVTGHTSRAARKRTEETL